MPRATERLRQDSSTKSTQEAISATIAELVRAGYSQEEATAIAYKEARKKTGEGLRKNANTRSS